MRLEKWEFELMILYIVLSIIVGILFGLYYGFDIGIIMFVLCASLSIATVYGLNYHFKKKVNKNE